MKVLDREGGMVVMFAQQCDCTQCCVHEKVKTVNFMLGMFCHNEKASMA
jgi:hypothetical protein